jgi:hypothetical protein
MACPGRRRRPAGEEHSELVVAGHLASLVPGERASSFDRQVGHRRGEPGLEVMSAAAVRQVDELDAAAGAVDQRADGGGCPDRR